jgi:hypothetical protein
MGQPLYKLCLGEIESMEYFNEVARREIRRIENPWKNATIEIDVLEVDKDIYNSLKDAWAWDKQPEDKKKYRIEYKFPLPINGNFIKAKYLLLYSNPASEMKMISDSTKNKLLKCFKLDDDAEFVIANDDWSRFYTKELNRFFRSKEDLSKEETKIFLNQFCFINFCAYSTGLNTFNFSDSQIKKEISNFASTKFVVELVNKWIDFKGSENVFIVRAREYVWRNHENIFSKLDLQSLEEDRLTTIYVK